MRFATPDYIFEAAELERWHGSLDLYDDEAWVHARAREDRLADHVPPNALAWMASPALLNGTPSVSAAALSSQGAGTDGGHHPKD